MGFAGIKELMREVKFTIKLVQDITAFLPEKAVLSAGQDLDHCLLIKCRDQHQTAQCFLQAGDLFKISDAVDQRLLQASETKPVSGIHECSGPKQNAVIENPVILEIMKPAASRYINLVENLIGISEDLKTAVMGNGCIGKQHSTDLIAVIYRLMRLQADDCVQISPDPFDIPFFQIIAKERRSSGVIAKICGDIASGKTAKINQFLVVLHQRPSLPN